LLQYLQCVTSMRNYLLARHTISKRYINNNVFFMNLRIIIYYINTHLALVSRSVLRTLLLRSAICFFGGTYIKYSVTPPLPAGITTNWKFELQTPPTCRLRWSTMLQQVYTKFDCWLYVGVVVYVTCNCTSNNSRHTAHRTFVNIVKNT